MVSAEDDPVLRYVTPLVVVGHISTIVVREILGCPKVAFSLFLLSGLVPVFLMMLLYLSLLCLLSSPFKGDSQSSFVLSLTSILCHSKVAIVATFDSFTSVFVACSHSCFLSIALWRQSLGSKSLFVAFIAGSDCLLITISFFSKSSLTLFHLMNGVPVMK